jgi:hypothetical protein
MNKGTRVIDNIAALKFSKENKISNQYNLIVGYPNENTDDFEETKKNIQIFKQFLDPPQICYLRVVYKSPIFCSPENFNISKLKYANIDKLMFPDEILDNKISFVYSFKNENLINSNEWIKLVDKWKIECEMLQIETIKSQNLTERLIFYFVDGGNFIKIYDKRNLKNVQIFTLNEIERDIFLSCRDIISFKNLKEKFSRISEDDLLIILNEFVENGILFSEDEFYLSLPLCINLANKDIHNVNLEQKSLITSFS